jgi:hypothetical protein
MLGYLSTIHLMLRGASHHVECGGLPPLSAARRLPGRASRINPGPPISRLAPSPFLAFAFVGHNILCPANMLGYLSSIRHAFTGAVMLSEVARVFASRVFRGRATQSKDLSSI